METSPEPDKLTPGTELKSRYRIEAELGSGGMSVVYRALDTLNDCPCAIKQFFIPSLSIRDVTRGYGSEPSIEKKREAALVLFRQEAKLLNRLTHPNLPKVTDYFDDSNNFYLSMDYVEGQDLEQWKRRSHEPLSVQQVIDWFLQVLDAVVYCHEQGVVHRDIKPENIIVTREGRAVLVDFGIARYTDEMLNPVSVPAGTAHYSAPEQDFSGTNIRSDIYSLGATMYMLFSGEPPQKAHDRKQHDQLISLLESETGITPALNHLITKALALDPSDRYQTAKEMYSALLEMTHPWQWTQGPGPVHNTDRTGLLSAPGILHTLRKGQYDLEGYVTGTNRPILIALDGDRRIFIARESGEIDMYEEHFGRLVRRAVFALNPLLSGVQVQILDIATDSTGCIVLAQVGSASKRVLYRIGEQPPIQTIDLPQKLPHNLYRMACFGDEMHFVTESHMYVFCLQQGPLEVAIMECIGVNAIAASTGLVFVAGLHKKASDSQPMFTIWKRLRNVYDAQWQHLSTIQSSSRFLLASDIQYGQVYAVTMNEAGSVVYILGANSGEVLSIFCLRDLHDVLGIAVGLGKVLFLAVKPTGQSLRWYGRQRLVLQRGHISSSESV